jgi:drug/metabolite transporter (DMT)-like permease
MSQTRIAHPGIVSALWAALLFGASTPLAKLLTNEMPPVLLAGLLYLGSGVGLLGWLALRRLLLGQYVSAMLRGDMPWLGGAILAGGVLGPALLMVGLTRTSAASASLLLNLEGVLTALLAWFVFKENVDRRIALGMGLIVLGGVLLSWQGEADLRATTGAGAIAGACLCWAIDNNLTRKVSAGDAVLIAGIKGLVAGSVNVILALFLGASLPAATTVVAAGVVGLLGYGVSLVLFVLALRQLGTARTGAYFSAAPFIGVAISLALFRERPDFFFWAAAVSMALGVWLHLTERHEHWHAHGVLTHAHHHVHDEHHQHEHEHDLSWNGKEPHSHRHVHQPLAHSHPHYPDIHHRH